MSAIQKYKKEALEARQALAELQKKFDEATARSAELRKVCDWLLLLHMAPIDEFDHLSRRFKEEHPSLWKVTQDPMQDLLFYRGLRFNVLGERE